jgi:hypothetical protein
MGILAGRGAGAVLSSSGHFALGTLLNRDVESKYPEGPDFAYWIQVFLGASDQNSLFNGTVRLTEDTENTHGISKQAVIDRWEQNKRAVADVVTLAKQKKGSFPLPVQWVSEVGTHYGLTLDQNETEQLAESLSAAYGFVKRIYDDAAANRSYNTTKRPGDFVDSHHLWYLCDPSLHILTADTNIKPRCSESPQSSRIIEYNSFL